MSISKQGSRDPIRRWLTCDMTLEQSLQSPRLTIPFSLGYRSLLLGILPDRISSFYPIDLLHRDIISQLKTLVDIANRVWRSNMQIMSFIAHMKTSTHSPELRYTWFQEPIRFEDAMGRVIPIPSEYNWEARSFSSCPIHIPS